MRPVSIFIFSALIAVAASYITVKSVSHSASSTNAVQQSAFDRVKQSGVLRCAYATWPPAMIKDANTGKLSGINYDVMEAIGRELDLKIEWTEEVSFGNYIEGLNTGRYDALCTTQWPDPARIRFQTFTRPYYYTPAYAYVRVNDNRFDGDLNKINDPAVKIATQDGDMSVTAARIDYPKASQYSLPQMADAQEMFLAVVSGKADINVSDEGNFYMFEKNNPGILRRIRDVTPSHIYGEFIPVQDGETHLRDMLDVAITQLINNGRIEQILNKHAPGIYMAPARDYK